MVLLETARRDEKGLTRGEFKCTFYGDPEFPPLLREIHDPPLMLFYRGELPDPSMPSIAVVGTRRPTGNGRKAAFRFGLEAGRAGIAVVSGLARGIDYSAHVGNTGGGGRSVAVLGNGIDRIYPASSTRAAHDILEAGGCIMSEYGVGVPPLRYHFPERNRIISGVARAVVVIEAPGKSGALITAEFALEQGRDLFVHADCLSGPSNEGCRRLYFDGAVGIRSAGDIFEDWGIQVPGGDAPGRKTRTVSTVRGAELLRREIEGELVTYAGEYFEK